MVAVQAVLAVEAVTLLSDAATRRRSLRASGAYRWSEDGDASAAAAGEGESSSSGSGDGGGALETLVDYLRGKASFESVAAMSPQELKAAIDAVDSDVLNAAGADGPEARQEAKEVVEHLRAEFAKQLGPGGARGKGAREATSGAATRARRGAGGGTSGGDPRA
ncbi:hypothetical protein FOA52_004600 [Chlamydomonas sp. UWO 241]|nr:hypothetical protein FOA52_004600 [Chlamydomonas sp. UWO 241]